MTWLEKVSSKIPMYKNVAAVVMGCIVASAVMMVCEYTNSKLFPFPAGFDTRDLEQVRAFAATMSYSSLVLVFVGWVIGSFAGGWVSTRIATSNQRYVALTVGALLTLGGVFNAWMIQNPLWFHVGTLPIFCLCTYWGYVFAQWGRRE